MVAGHIMGIEKGKQEFRQELSEQVGRLNSIEESLGLERLVDNELLRNKILQTCLHIENNYVEPISMDSISEIVIPNIIKELDRKKLFLSNCSIMLSVDPSPPLSSSHTHTQSQTHRPTHRYTHSHRQIHRKESIN